MKNDQKNNLIQKIMNSNNNNNINMFDIKINLIKLNNKIDEDNILISKLKFDKKNKNKIRTSKNNP